MPRVREEDYMTLQLECWPDDLSPAQLAAFEKAENEHLTIRSKLNEIVSSSGGENLFLGEIFSAYQVAGSAPGLETISKPVATVRKEAKAKQLAEEKRVRADREAHRKKELKNQIEIIDDDEDEDYIPLSKRTKNYKTEKKKEPERKPVRGATKSSPVIQLPTTVPHTFRPTESTAIGGLSVGQKIQKKEVVDLTKDDTVTKAAADSREITFNKLQGKTFPSLVVVARPSLKVKENINDRPALDAKVKSVLMHTATKYTEWLIQQGLVRSEQTCQIHTGGSLKLGMYSDATKFPYSGGYVWISECCPTRFVSVFSGSLFEGAPHPPSILLKLIYHWSCQTNVQNVVQWVKVDNLYVKGLYTWLRSVCTVALYQHMNLLGGHGKKIEVGVISLGTTSQDGQQRQVKVEVLGVLDYEAKIVRLRAVEPLNDGERNYKKRFSKILEPLSTWVNKDSQILTDLTVDKGTLHSMGYKYVVQATATDGKGKNCNANIMDYLRRIVPRMFQNTLSLLSRQIIQQFLDELVWREWYGTTPGLAFDNIVSHISEQTRLDGKESLVLRLNKVAANPFRNWAHFATKTPAKALRDDFFSAPSTSHKISSSPTTSTGKRARKRREPSPEYVPNRKIKEEPKQKPEKKVPPKVYEPPKKPEPTIFLESYYYGIYAGGELNESGKRVRFNVQCPICHENFTSNPIFMNHIKQHANPTDETSVQCRYCLENWADQDKLTKHISLAHPVETKNALTVGGECIICETRFSTNSILANHMQKMHVAADLPYRCGCCNYASSALRHTIDHFYTNHSKTGMLQCPFCLHVYGVVDNDGSVLSQNITDYYEHMKQHLIKVHCKKCKQCVLAFTTKGAMKVHQMYAHNSLQSKGKSVASMCKNTTKIAKPKFKANASKENINFLAKYNRVTMFINNGKICLECDTDFEEKGHFTGLMRCGKCKYQTCCLRAMMEHGANCVSGINLETTVSSSLDLEMHCICGFSSSDGNALARHLASCDRRSAYASVEAAQENVVKRNMLDMLGLVRRGGEDGGDDSDDLLQPVERSGENVESEDENATAPSASAELAPPATTDEPMDTSDQQFNTTLSLDDLAPPSVAPQPETDRTPQLSDEYQSLATPRVGPPTEIMHEHNEFSAIHSQSDYGTL